MRLGSSTLGYIWHSCYKSFRGRCGCRGAAKPAAGPVSKTPGSSVSLLGRRSWLLRHHLNINVKYAWGGVWSWSSTRIIIISLSCRQDLATLCRILCSLSIWTQNLIRDKNEKVINVPFSNAWCHNDISYRALIKVIRNHQGQLVYSDQLSLSSQMFLKQLVASCRNPMKMVRLLRFKKVWFLADVFWKHL